MTSSKAPATYGGQTKNDLAGKETPWDTDGNSVRFPQKQTNKQHPESNAAIFGHERPHMSIMEVWVFYATIHKTVQFDPIVDVIKCISLRVLRRVLRARCLSRIPFNVF